MRVTQPNLFALDLVSNVLRVSPRVDEFVACFMKKETSTGIRTLKWIERDERRCWCGLQSRSQSTRCSAEGVFHEAAYRRDAQSRYGPGRAAWRCIGPDERRAGCQR